MNRSGQVVGIFIGRVLRSADAMTGLGDEGIALPIERVDDVLNPVLTSFQGGRGWIGITVKNLVDAAGVRVIKVVPRGPAYQAGISKGDTLIGFEGSCPVLTIILAACTALLFSALITFLGLYLKTDKTLNYVHEKHKNEISQQAAEVQHMKDKCIDLEVEVKGLQESLKFEEEKNSTIVSQKKSSEVRLGQEVVAKKAWINDFDPASYIKEVMSERLKKVAKSEIVYGTEKATKGSQKAGALRVKQVADKAIKTVKEAKIKSAQSILDSIICK